MNRSGIIKYRIGLGVIGLFTVIMLVLVLIQAGVTKQDTQTDKLANSMADSLNSYTDSNFAVPATLRQAGIIKTSPYITYTKVSNSKYKFCVTYKTTSSNFDPSMAVNNVLMGGVSSWDSSSSAGTNTDLYIPISHHKGVNCQTVDLGSDGLTGGYGCGGNSLKLGASAGIMCPLQSGGSGAGTSGVLPDGCGQSYDASSEDSVVMSITSSTIQIASPGVAPHSFSIASGAKFFDVDCQPISASSVHVGDTVIVFSSMSAGGATTIQKTLGS